MPRGSGTHLEENCSFKKFSLLKIDFSKWVVFGKTKREGDEDYTIETKKKFRLVIVFRIPKFGHIKITQAFEIQPKHRRQKKKIEKLDYQG